MQDIEQILVDNYRTNNPKSRIVSIIKHVHNSACYKQMGCVLCGQSGPRFATKWRKTKQAYAWEHEHKEHHFQMFLFIRKFS